MGCNCSGCPEEEVAASVMVSVEVPGGVTIGGGGATATEAEPPPQPARPRDTQKIPKASIPQNAKRFLALAHSNARLFRSNKRISATASSGSRGVPEIGRGRRGADGGRIDKPAVFTVTVKVAAVPLARETAEGTWHVAASGAPLQASETLPVNPCPGVI